MSTIIEEALTQSDQEALEALVVDNPDLERLESPLDEFNIFEAIGAVRQELRHSDFLAFLLNPQQNHGLGDTFVRQFLQKVLVRNGIRTPISPVELNLWSLNQIVVLREWRNIDILLRDEQNRFLVIIENKIGSSEHSNQLQKYREEVRRQYPAQEWRVLCLYLTPSGELPSHEEYLPVDYGFVADVLDRLSESRASTLGTEVQVLIKHYVQMIRRHIMGDAEIRDLCQRIYEKHQRALSLIYEYKPDQQATMGELLQTLVTGTKGLLIDHSTKNAVVFVPEEWDGAPALMTGTGWSKSSRILRFVIDNHLTSLKIRLVIGPGPETTRKAVFNVATQHQPPFKSVQKLSPTWHTIYSHTLVDHIALEEVGTEALEDKVRKNWEHFLANDAAKVRKLLEADTEIFGSNTVT